QVSHAGLFQLANMAGGNTTTFFDQDVAILVLDIKRRNITPQTAWHQLQVILIVQQGELAGFKEHVQDFLGGISQSTQQNRGRKLTTAVNPHEDGIFRVKLEVEPGTTVRNDPC